MKQGIRNRSSLQFVHVMDGYCGIARGCAREDARDDYTWCNVDLRRTSLTRGASMWPQKASDGPCVYVPLVTNVCNLGRVDAAQHDSCMPCYRLAVSQPVKACLCVYLSMYTRK